METTLPAKLSSIRPLALFVTLPTLAKARHVDPEKASRNLVLLGISPDGALQYGARLIPIFTQDRANEVGAALEQLR